MTPHPPPPPGHWYFRLDIIFVKGLSKHTLNTYFSGTKVDPKYVFSHAFFFICPSCPFQNLSYDQKHTLFSNFARFPTPKTMYARTLPGLEKNPNYVDFYEDDIPTSNTSGPPRPTPTSPEPPYRPLQKG